MDSFFEAKTFRWIIGGTLSVLLALVAVLYSENQEKTQEVRKAAAVAAEAANTAVTRVMITETRFMDILRRLDRMESKLDGITEGRFRR